MVTISPGRFHHFDLARQLSKNCALKRFYVGYPNFQLRKHGFHDRNTVTFPWIETPYMALGRLGWMTPALRRVFERLIPSTLDRFAELTLPKCDALIALSQSGLHAGRKIRKSGGIYICDRGSSHIKFQNDILHEEFRRWGQSFAGVDPWVVCRELAEYLEADMITVPSGYVRRSFVEKGVSAAKLRVIPYGVDLSNFFVAGSPPKDSFEVLFVGQVGFRKGVPDLIDAFARLRHPKKRFRLAGVVQPEMKKYLEQFPVAPDIQFLGHVPSIELKALMSTSHVMVLASVEEGLALVMAQAMACGCPVIASVHTGAEDLFEDGNEGFIVPIRQPEIIAERLQRLADNPGERDRMGKASLERVKTLGGWDAYGERVISTILEFESCRDFHNLPGQHA